MTDYLSQESALPEVDYEKLTGYSIDCVRNYIRKRAYEIFEDRGRQPNHELDDWLQAEREANHHFGL